MPAGSKLPLSAPVIVSIVAAIAAAGLWSYLTFAPQQAAPPPPALTGEAKQYLPNLKLSDVGIQAAESYIQASLVEIVGKISNQGSRTVKLVEVNCVFRDRAGQIVKRERVTVAGRKTGPLAPGGTKPFRLAFDNIPDNWNRAMPDLVIAQIQFA